MEIGRNIAEIRKEKGFSQKELAEKVGISRKYLSDIERGKKQASTRLLALIAFDLDKALDEFRKEN